ncbi:hypothetical protein BO83DRAFT_43114 [Aspergillus eucalypticola CBS 122712]|uniref:Uncharacterized protein n=1 Tax=Aspergillus eucalypticola (strain CBS 122712 / IBT 29274) TaxID=1448314 RepID=A0A317VBY6_ASPEC|nr:uncharacterized protein BO83DRAFT_43114 [Aspergillus eucalypticola CBS 122712]PWY71874.1 hypothetical protein BO83DRAFT_43114 [Aspergillus eucalypticola CBS 122712]
MCPHRELLRRFPGSVAHRFSLILFLSRSLALSLSLPLSPLVFSSFSPLPLLLLFAACFHPFSPPSIHRAFGAASSSIPLSPYHRLN